MTCWCWWRSRSISHGGEAAAELRLDGYGDVWRGLALPWLLSLYIGLGGSVGPPNTVHMTWGNPRDEWDETMKKSLKTGGFRDLDHAIRAAKRAGCAHMAGR
jgi:hypothetical protein